MPIFNIPVARPRPFRTEEERSQIRRRKEEVASRINANDTRLPLSARLEQFRTKSNFNKEDASKLKRTSTPAWHKKKGFDRNRTNPEINSSNHGRTKILSKSTNTNKAKLISKSPISKSNSHERPKINFNERSKKVNSDERSKEKKTLDIEKRKSKSKSNRILLKIEPKQLTTMRQKKINHKEEVAHFDRQNFKTATILPISGPNIGIEETLKVTGLSQSELQIALQEAAERTTNSILKMMKTKPSRKNP